MRTKWVTKTGLHHTVPMARNLPKPARPSHAMRQSPRPSDGHPFDAGRLQGVGGGARLDAWRQASEQYFTASQFLAQALRQVIGRWHTQHSLLGSVRLLPLKSVDMGSRFHAHDGLLVLVFRQHRDGDASVQRAESLSGRNTFMQLDYIQVRGP